MKIGLLLFVFFVGANATRPFPSVVLPVHQDSFVKVFVGVPGKHMVLRVHRECNDTMILFDPPGSYSKSYTQHEPGSGTEIFMLGPHALRLRVRYSNQILIDEQEADGFA